MKRYFLFISALLAATLPVAAQQPLYIVNGVETEQIASIPPDDIENVEMLPADEETIARYGEPAARIVLRYTVTPEGDTVVAQELESTDSRLKRRVLKAVAEAPRWTPARKNGTPVESEGILHIQLPEGKLMPRQVELVWR